MSEANSKKELFETMPVPKAVAMMSIPSVIASLVMMLYSMADTFFVGALNDSIQTAAVTLATPVILAFNAVNNLFGVGASSLMSRSLGAQDYETTRRSSAFAIYCSMFSGLLFSVIFTVFKTQLLHILGTDETTYAATEAYTFWTVTCGAIPAILNVVLGYLVRSEGAATHASIGTMSGCFLNIILDPIFILPQFLNMGAAGAGLATFIANIVAVLYFVILIIVKRSKTFVSFNPVHFRPDRKLVSQVFGVGLPAAVQNLLNVTGQTILNNFAAGYGAVVVSAIGISHKIIMMPLMIAMGVSNGIMPLVSYNYTSGDHRRMKRIIGFTYKICIGFLAVMTAVYFIFSPQLMNMFMKDADIVAYGSVFIKIACFSLPFMGLDWTSVGAVNALGMGRKALFFCIFRKVLTEIPAMYIIGAIIPVYGLAAAQPFSELLTGIVATVTLTLVIRKIDRSDSGEKTEIEAK